MFLGKKTTENRFTKKIILRSVVDHADSPAISTSGFFLVFQSDYRYIYRYEDLKC